MEGKRKEGRRKGGRKRVKQGRRDGVKENTTNLWSI